ncbi:MAG: DctP family TRAP transporter solute-binding subunit [Candidatus Adiutrix sp.]|jgi:tripartite ATP-independent transporter DctP family solute receptor|nr:DctP family TRAP transporter solute-binding subunit [Candidatus Adiutrix sp.]
MKNRLLSLLAGLALLSSAPAAFAADYTLRIAFIGPESHGQYIGLNTYFKPEMEKRTNGRVAVEIYPNAQLGSDRQAIEGVSLGTLEMAAIGGSSLLPLDDRIKFMDLPFLFPDGDVAYKAYSEFLTAELNSILEPHDLTILSAAELGFRHITNNRKPITRPEDLKGLKLRTMENPLHVATFKLLGANPTPVAFSELYTALQQGTVDAQENPINVIATGKLYEVQKYLSLTGHIYSPAMYLISTSYYNDLPEDIRRTIDEVSGETQPIIHELLVKQNQDYVEELKAAGVQVNDLTAEEKQAFRNLCQPVYDEYVQKYGDGLIKKIEAIR